MAPHLSAIRPGADPLIDIDTPVNVVFVGFGPKDVNVNKILGQMPKNGVPDIYFDAAVGGHEQNVNIRYDYRYTSRFADKSFDDAFFSYLASIALPRGLDWVEQYYNDEAHNSLDVGPTVDDIDGAATEKWLEQQSARRLGIPGNQYTVFLINWWGRSDFQFHDYYHSSPDPDQGYDLGYSQAEARTRGWGGASGPTWFFDISAGPVWDDNSYDVDDPDFGTGVLQYRIPPVWDYGNTTAYRPFTDLSGDLARIIRYVAIDMLFSSSPTYDAAATVPAPGGGKHIQIADFEGDPSRPSTLADLHPDLVQANHQWLEPYFKITVGDSDQPLPTDLATAVNEISSAYFVTGTGAISDPACPGAAVEAEAEYVCYFAGPGAHYFPAHGTDTVLRVADIALPANPMPWLGYALPDEATGLPTMAVTIDPYVPLPPGYLYFHQDSETAIHEAGHLVGLSHPFDGYDPTTGVVYTTYGAFNFAWEGDEVASTMSYLPGTVQTFSVFDRDNVARWNAARLLDLADTDAAELLAKPSHLTARIDALLTGADADFARDLAALHRGDWIAAATAAVAGYDDIQRADALAGVVPASKRLAQLEQQSGSGSGPGKRPRNDESVADTHAVNPWSAPGALPAVVEPVQPPGGLP